MEAVRNAVNTVSGAAAQAVDTLKSKLPIPTQDRATAEPAGPPSEHPGRDPETLTLADNAGIETQGAIADESEAARARVAKVQLGSQDDGDTPFEDQGRAAAAGEELSTKPEHGMPSIAPHTLATSPASDVPSFAAGAESGGLSSHPIGHSGSITEESGRGAVDRHQEVLDQQESSGKIFSQEPVLPGGGVTVHGMVPASILMHTAQNTKRTGGSPHDAIAGVPDAPDVSDMEMAQGMAGAGPGTFDASVLPAEVPTPDATNAEGISLEEAGGNRA